MTADDDFWSFSLRVYSEPGVADECVAVQENYDVDVNVLLFCVWLGATGRIALSAEEMAECRGAVKVWHESVVRPMRAARRAMKGVSGAEDIRDQVKAIELEAERREQLKLFALAHKRWREPRVGSASEAARANLDLFLRTHGAPGANVVPILMGAVEAEIRRYAAS